MDTLVKPTPLPLQLCRDPVLLLALGFGSGCARRAPGTFGTLAALPLCWLASALPLAAYLFLTAAAFMLGVWLCASAAERLHVHDHPGIVWDEFVGLFITLAAAPAGWVWFALGFALFRFFDILKPWPIARLDRDLAGGLGIMTDDALAGVYAWGCLQLIAYAVI
jgi:phosphatidylglycerophosphatase A